LQRKPQWFQNDFTLENYRLRSVSDAKLAESKEPPEALGSVIYECERCGTRQTLEDLSKLPELTCINCGYRVLKKVRPPVVKRVDAV
jgi:DNA-directed RNA polymerase subunit P